jgi:serine/threonine protein kinase/tetratricopeptide (TPR) repeat protein
MRIEAMNSALSGRRWLPIGAVVDAYEAALARDRSAALVDFAPPPDHPERLRIIAELIRVDLEHRWQSGIAPRLETYRGLFPAVFEDRELLHAMAYEEYRLRQQAGEQPTPAEYGRRYGLEGCEWPEPPEPPAAREPGHELPSDTHRVGDPSAGMERAASAYRAYRREGTEQGGDLELQFSMLGVPPKEAELLRSLDRAAPHQAERLAEALGGLPRVGADFLGFQLCSELGRGAFGRVYLARQGDLSNRLVALKVSADVAGETRALAQLQHTNIVPIYSAHRRGPLQAVCMPYLGATTLADTLSDLRSQAVLPRSGDGLLSTTQSRKTAVAGLEPDVLKTPTAQEPAEPERADPGLAGPGDGRPTLSGPVAPQIERFREMGYVQAVLWLITRVTEGLAHAHERGILHRDLKPANILFADDGEPVLLDFNLAADTKTRLGASLAFIGGTLPYMAPEHLSAFREHKASVDGRSDIFALGVILFELLTSTHPFPVRDGQLEAILPQMIADRQGPAPDPRGANRAVSPAVAAIVRHCLEPDPARRYQTARQLQEDLKRQLDDLPLLHVPEPSVRERMGKWARRHPRLSSSTTVGLASMLLLLCLGSAFFVRNRHYQRVEARAGHRWLANERRQALAYLTPPFVDPVLAEEGLVHCRRVAERYGVLDDPAWLDRPLAAYLEPGERAELRQAVGDVLLLWAQALILRGAGRANQDRAGEVAAAARRLDVAEACFGSGSVPRALVLARAELAKLNGSDPAVESQIRAGAQKIPLRADLEQLLGEDPDQISPELRRRLLANPDAVVAHDPQNWAVWVALGNWNVRFHRVTAARSAYSVAVALAPGLWAPRYNRGLLDLDTKDYSQALEDFDGVIALRPDLAGAYLNRALAKLGIGDANGAVDDLTACLGMKRPPSRAWFVRAEARRRLGDLPGARLDRAEGLAHQPDEPAGFVARGLARLPGDTAGALADFDAALAIDPRNRFALQNKAHVLGEILGRGEDALKVLDTLLLNHPDQVEAVCGRGVQLARYGRSDAALRDAQAALTLDNGALTNYQVACIHALLAKQSPSRTRDALRFLSEALRKDGYWLSIARKDPDLAAIRSNPAFAELIRSAETLIRAGTK